MRMLPAGMHQTVRCSGRLLLVAFATAFAGPATHGGQNPSSQQIALSSPRDYQVFQRQNREAGRILICGRAALPADQAEVRVTGRSLNGPLPGVWVQMKLTKASGEFHGSVTEPAGGFYRVDIQLLRHHESVGAATVAHVGVGEVFVVSGQSNATNYGEVRQTSQTRMVVAFDGTSWRIADDPQPGVQDHSSKGSFIPQFGDALYRRYGVPIGIAAVGHGSTSVRQWLPAGDRIYVMPTMTKFVTRNGRGELVSDGILFDGMMLRIHQLGRHGFRALLWHQGESDADQPSGHQISPELYRKMMIRLIRAARRSAGWRFPWFVAEATYHSQQDPSSPSIEAAQRSLWHKGTALEGPNTDTLGSAYRQNRGKGVHFSDIGLRAHGALWAEAVEHWLDSILQSSR